MRPLTPAELAECKAKGQADFDAMTPEDIEEDPSVTVGDLIDYYIAVKEMAIEAEERKHQPENDPSPAPFDDSEIPY